MVPAEVEADATNLAHATLRFSMWHVPNFNSSFPFVEKKVELLENENNGRQIRFGDPSVRARASAALVLNQGHVPGNQIPRLRWGRRFL
jgi:hypothetical protein